MMQRPFNGIKKIQVQVDMKLTRAEVEKMLSFYSRMALKSGKLECTANGTICANKKPQPVATWLS